MKIQCRNENNITIMDIFVYEMGGIAEVRFLLSVKGEEVLISCNWITGEKNFTRKMLPFDEEKLNASLCQYVLSILVGTTHSPLLQNHVQQITKFSKLMNRVPFSKMTPEVKFKFLSVIKEGIKIWTQVISSLVSYQEEELEDTLGKIARYIMIFHVYLHN